MHTLARLHHLTYTQPRALNGGTQDNVALNLPYSKSRARQANIKDWGHSSIANNLSTDLNDPLNFTNPYFFKNQKDIK